MQEVELELQMIKDAVEKMPREDTNRKLEALMKDKSDIEDRVALIVHQHEQRDWSI